MMGNNRISRRRALQGLGTVMALPLLEAMQPTVRLRAAIAEAPQQPPRRMVFVYVPNGADMANWTPANEGPDYEFTSILEPLRELRDDFLILSGLRHDKADANGDGPGDHARASATFLTGCQAHKTKSLDIRAGTSVDQVAAAAIGQQTRFASLELGCDKGQQAGACDSGYSCAYQFNLAWKTPTLPLPPEVNPRAVFDRLFANSKQSESDEARAIRIKDRRSVLDFVLQDAHRLQKNLGSNDSRKLDEYLASVREIEQRLDRRDQVHIELPPGTGSFLEPPETYESHIQLMSDLIGLAFQTDSTRVITFMIAHDGSNRGYPFIDIPEGHHDLSHHGGDEGKKAKIARINRFHAEQFAYFLRRLKGIREGEGTLLDQCMIVYGSGISDGDEHSHFDLPVLLAGAGGGTIKPGRHIRHEAQTPMSNLYISLLDRMGAESRSFGDSTGPLPHLA